MRSSRAVLLAAAVTVVLFGAAAGSDTVIVVNHGPHRSAQVAGHAENQVNWLDADTADDVVCTESFAALELQRYLRQMTARAGDFTIVGDDVVPAGEVILVGGPASNGVARRLADELGVTTKRLADLGREGYCIKTARIQSRNVTAIAGGGRIGTLYGAYDLLHRMGCRWFAPGVIGEDVPRVVWQPDFDVIGRPSFVTRGFHAWEDRAGTDFLLWMARNRLNYWCVEQSNHPLLHKLGIQMACGGHKAQSLFLNPSGPYPYNHQRFASDDQKPQDPYPGSDEYQGDADSDGTLSYFEAHPEWYALVGGRRAPGIRDGFGTNYCTSNLHATAECMKNYVAALADGPYRDADVVRFWTLDVGKWCECPECRALGAPTDRNLLLVRRLDKEIKRARAAGWIERPITIRFLAYADVLDPPTRSLPDGFDYDTCSATFFPIVRCYVHNFGDECCPRNSGYLKQLNGWATDPERHYQGQICIGEYYNVSGYRNLPICVMHTMAIDIPYFHSVGARHFHYMHVTTGSWGNKALTNYQMASQLWDVRLDCEELWRDYFTRRYGAAATTMQQFYASLEHMLSNVSELKYGLARRLDRGADNLFPTKHLRYDREPGVECDGVTLVEIVRHAKTCRRLLDKVRQQDVPERIKARIAEDEQMFTYGERTVLYYNACVQAYQLARSARLDEARGQLREAKRLGDLLRQDTTSVSHCYTPNDPNALVASRADKALARLDKLLNAEQ